MEYKKQVRSEADEKEIERLNHVDYANLIEMNGLEISTVNGNHNKVFTLEEIFTKKLWSRSVLWAAFIAGDSFSGDFDVNSTKYHIYGHFEKGQKEIVLFKEFVSDDFDADIVASALVGNYEKMRKVVRSTSYNLFTETAEGDLEHRVRWELEYEDGKVDVRFIEESTYAFGSELTSKLQELMGECVVKAWREESDRKSNLDLDGDTVFALFSNGRYVIFSGDEIS